MKPQIALARVDDLLNKVFVLGVALLTVDVVQNAMRQVQYLNPIWFWTTFGALLLSVLGALLAAFRIGNTRYWYRAMILVVLVTMLTWKFQMMDDPQLPHDYKPWIWWALGYTTLAAAGAWHKRWAYAALIIGPIIWLIVETSPEGGGAALVTAIQDSLYSFFFTTALALLVIVLRDRAIEVDVENNLALEALLRRTQEEVLNRERALFNSILHDKVLYALGLAAEASTDKLKQKARTAAKDAITRLELEWDYGLNPPEEISTDSFIKPLIQAIHSESETVDVDYIEGEPIQVPFAAAAGIYEATLLAVNNSITHAPNATKRSVSIRQIRNGLKVVITDNGRGFRMSNVHKTALGVRWTIFERLESVGVKARLDAKPGEGATWILEWKP